jgi:membrane-associated phospholipid phosphatase
MASRLIVAPRAEIGIRSTTIMSNDQKRANAAFQVREDAAKQELSLPLPTHASNGDEARYANRVASFSKGLLHDDLGHVIVASHDAMLAALASGAPADFEQIPPGGARRFTNPQAGLSFDLEGADSHALAIPPAPSFAGKRQAGEMVENYWMALCRDEHFESYGASATVAAAAADLAALSEYQGPKTAPQLFRGKTPDDLKGPYVSQFLWLDVPFGALTIDQRMRTVVKGLDYVLDHATWVQVQNGKPQGNSELDSEARYIRNGRDLGQWVHVDALYEAYFNACLILLGAGAPLDDNNPYAGSKTQDGFATFGGPHILSLVTEVATRALKAVWFQKWFVHRRIRPEALGGLVDNHKNQRASYDLHPELLGSGALEAVRAQNEAKTLGAQKSSYLLPLAFPEGSPIHPSYGAGHATVAGACVTILKAWFKESTKMNALPTRAAGKLSGGPVVASADGKALSLYAGADSGDLTVGGELNKIAANVAIGRNFAGVHWRSDYEASIELGEQIAISVLRGQKKTYNEPFKGFSLTKFNGQTVVV